MLAVAEESTEPAYDRDRFDHWIDADNDGCNTRYEVLIAESTSAVNVDAGCVLSAGTWVSPYDGLVASAPADIEIDHVVALAEAWRSGAWKWTDEQRRAFANDIDVPYALTIASSEANQAKADKDPSEWLPANGAYVCEYVLGWALVKYRYSLTVDQAEAVAIQSQLSLDDCADVPFELPDVVVAPTEDDPAHTTIAPFTDPATRLGGPDRYAVAVGVSQRYAPRVPVAYIAKGGDFPDALSAASAAAMLGGPLLLTPTADLHPAVAAELTRLRPDRIIVVGGEGSITPAVFDRLQDFAPSVSRDGGVDRYEASRNITASAFPSATTAFIATGRTFADALAASGAAGKLGAPVLLVDGVQPAVPATTTALLAGLGVTQVYIAGGPASVSETIRAQLQTAGFSVARLGGADRYQVAANINAEFFNTDANTGFFATGLNFPDALAGAALAGRLGAPLFVTAPSCLPGVVKLAADRLALEHRVFLGGIASVSENVAANRGCLSTGTPSISGYPIVGQTLSASPGVGWTNGTSFSYTWYANYVYAGSGPTLALTSSHYNKIVTVAVEGTHPEYVGGAPQAAGLSTPVTYPGRTAPIDSWTCPAWAPIKGNANSMIYHVPGGGSYDITNPEECFRTESDAVAAGYRRARN